MGFILFEKSGTFNPTDFGLSPGDTIFITVVGGGGGGGSVGEYTSSISVRYHNGGNGGSSSFGSILSAAGGSGGQKGTNFSTLRNTMQNAVGTFKGTPGRYLAGSVRIGGNGAGGFLLDKTDLNGDALPPQMHKFSDSSVVTHTTKIFRQDTLSSPPPYKEYFSSDSYNDCDFEVTMQGSLWFPVVYNLKKKENFNSVIFLATHPKRAGNGINYEDGLEDFMPTSVGPVGMGGIGYGAGGGGATVQGQSSSYTDYLASGGNSGEIKSTYHKLTSLSAIAVTVGGGGSGAASSYQNTNDGAGQAGSGGSYGNPVTACNGSDSTTVAVTSGRGGYNGVFGSALDAYYTTNSAHICAGGGGAGGCVAVWW